MATIWKKNQGETKYKVTRAGNAIRLYRNNVLHSQWNPRKPVSGKLWDLFLLSSFETKKVSRVLVLGAGGGAIVNLIHHYFPKAHVDAIDLDKAHLYVAKKYFNVSSKCCNLVHMEAQRWLKENNTDKYDLIVDDVFYESNSVPYRSIIAQSAWMKSLLKRLKRKGVLVINFADKKELKNSAKLWKKNDIVKEFHIGIATHYACDNQITHISRKNISSKKLFDNLSRYTGNDYLRYINDGTISYANVQ